MNGRGPAQGEDRQVLITGGAGFIGANVADRLASAGDRVIIYDNLSRDGVARNLAWLRARHGERIEVEVADVRDAARLARAVERARHVFHFAAQVAVTTSLVDPAADFEVNARGTLNVLSAVRRAGNPPTLLFTSTNKVYGALSDVLLEARGGRYVPFNPELRDQGVGEQAALDFYSPYGCSKGCADQYVLDHARIYGLSTCVFRMSCIYGPRQLGTEDQGWVAHFVRRALAGQPIAIYGNGLQVRDALFVDDLVDAMQLAQRALEQRRDDVVGHAFNIGGGPAHAVSLLELVDRITASVGERPDLTFGPWRPGDQRYYVSNTARFRRATGWSPRVDVVQGLERLVAALRGDELVQQQDTRALAAAGAAMESALR
ncbi:MAG TPA: SDR family NAD(P)-dependent oxidoreductase [Polyangia bacterium]|nr:SDR family NAD(P)-dependent oxidoreductase [Polyangia bacterium]